MSALNHRLSDLHWGLWCGHLDWEPLRVREMRSLHWGDFPVIVRILATSHSVSIETPEGLVHELVTCAAPPPGSIALLDQPGEASADIAGLTWTSSISIGRLDQVPVGDLRVESVFPGDDGARTVVVCSVGTSDLVIESFHGYPEEGKALVGRSRVCRRRL